MRPRASKYLKFRITWNLPAGISPYLEPVGPGGLAVSRGFIRSPNFGTHRPGLAPSWNLPAGIPSLMLPHRTCPRSLMLPHRTPGAPFGSMCSLMAPFRLYHLLSPCGTSYLLRGLPLPSLYNFSEHPLRKAPAGEVRLECDWGAFRVRLGPVWLTRIRKSHFCST